MALHVVRRSADRTPAGPASALRGEGTIKRARHVMWTMPRWMATMTACVRSSTASFCYGLNCLYEFRPVGAFL